MYSNINMCASIPKRGHNFVSKHKHHISEDFDGTRYTIKGDQSAICANDDHLFASAASLRLCHRRIVVITSPSYRPHRRRPSPWQFVVAIVGTAHIPSAHRMPTRRWVRATLRSQPTPYGVLMQCCGEHEWPRSGKRILPGQPYTIFPLPHPHPGCISVVAPHSGVQPKIWTTNIIFR